MDTIKLVHSIIKVVESKLQSKSLGQVTTFIRKIGAFSNDIQVTTPNLKMDTINWFI